jgi:hypothetical protein
LVAFETHQAKNPSNEIASKKRMSIIRKMPIAATKTALAAVVETGDEVIMGKIFEASQTPRLRLFFGLILLSLNSVS